MAKTLPPPLSPEKRDAALRAFARVVGAEALRVGEADLAAYRDDGAAAGAGRHVAAAAVLPASTEQVQAILRLANEHGIPLWPVSRGQNFGYGAAAPLLSGSVVLDLSRMNRILEVNEKLGYAVVEPGVSFFELYDFLRAKNSKLWLSTPGHGLGSVIGNALERGFGFTPYGDHTSKLCGLEVVLPSGELLRTGMGAMAGARAWRGYPYGFGPHWDQMFVQSNFGVVTQAGIWLMPEPEATIGMRINLPEADDIGWFIDDMAALRLRGVFEQPLFIGNYLRTAMVFSRRADWVEGPGPIPDDVARRMMKKFDIGWWTADLRLFGPLNVVRCQAEHVRRALRSRLDAKLDFQLWQMGDPIEVSGAGLPSRLSLDIANWRGGAGGSIGFSPVLPADGGLVRDHARRVRARFDQFGLDYYANFALFQRHVTNINLIVHDRDDPAQGAAAKNLFAAVVEDAAREGFGEYRTHLDYMQSVADTFDFNHHALGRLNETVKDALDPEGILAPGKNGIWPRKYRDSS
jgi:4-cresol dehydrogenase (hydroxylating)